MEQVFAETFRAMIDYWMVNEMDKLIDLIAVLELAAQAAVLLMMRSNSAAMRDE
jgi:hypothetical protein